MIFSNEYLETLYADAETEITNSLNCIYYRYPLEIVANQSIYILDTLVRGVKRVTWKGKLLTPISFQELCILNPAFVVLQESGVSGGGGYFDPAYFDPAYFDETTDIDSFVGNISTTGTPLYYCLYPNGYRNICFYPTPSEAITLTTTEDVYGADINGHCVISCWRNSDEDYTIPDYVARRTKKAYVMYKAFAIEGKGQDLNASRYYKAKFDYLIEYFKSINEGVFVAKKYQLTGGTFQRSRLARPVLPSSFTEI